MLEFQSLIIFVDATVSRAVSLARQPSPWPQIMLPILLLTSLASPMFRLRRMVFITAIASTISLCYLNPWPRTLGLRYGLANSWFFYLHVIQKLLDNPEWKYWRKSRKPREALSMRGFSLQKFQWAASLLINPRGIGWNFEGRHLPAPGSDRSASMVLFERFLKAAMSMMILLWIGGYVSNHPLPAMVSLRTFPNILTNELLFFTTTYCSWTLQWCTVSIIGILSGLSRVEVIACEISLRFWANV
jgi:hypothetical protein